MTRSVTGEQRKVPTSNGHIPSLSLSVPKPLQLPLLSLSAAVLSLSPIALFSGSLGNTAF